VDDTSQSSVDLIHSRRALELAAAGKGLVSPNPLVGCVIVDASGIVVGEGTYTHEGVVHAEAIALEQAGVRAAGGTAYVSLEPHDHQSKTEPCTEALIRAGIRRVVCPIEYPNPLVSGRGFARLRAAGVELATGLLAAEARKLNEHFICWHEKQRPFVHLKLAASLDGRISVDRSVSTALSGPKALERVHQLRHRHDAILVGGGTAAADDPMLTDRSGLARRRPLVRVVLDNRLRLTTTSRLAVTAREFPTIVYSSDQSNSAATLSSAGVEVVRIDAKRLDLVLDDLRRRNIQSLLVEGGSAVAGSFVDAKLVDKITFIFAPLVVGGKSAPVAVEGRGAASLDEAFRLDDVSVTRVDEDVEITGYPALQQSDHAG
jgi:diaminohydroxyphosphoribosylaminopyrimidine deaminase/5-amino-6-(5-phosphoribosylamino)uracil reductase